MYNWQGPHLVLSLSFPATPKNRPKCPQKETSIYSNHPFSRVNLLLVSGRLLIPLKEKTPEEKTPPIALALVTCWAFLDLVMTAIRAACGATWVGPRILDALQRAGWYLHPWRLTWNIIMEVWKIIFLSKWVICRFHVNLPRCKVYRFTANNNNNNKIFIKVHIFSWSVQNIWPVLSFFLDVSKKSYLSTLKIIRWKMANNLSFLIQKEYT